MESRQPLSLILLTLLLLNLPCQKTKAEIPNPTFYDEYTDGAEDITYEGLVPYATYQLEIDIDTYATTGVLNECGMLTVKPPSPKIPLIFEPQSDARMLVSMKPAGNYLFKNTVEDNIVGYDLPENQINCAGVVPLWMFSKVYKKGTKVILYNKFTADPLPRNTTIPVKLAALDISHPWKLIKKAKANPCGIVTFKY